VSVQLERLASALSDRYTIERVLGVGGMATVYLAEDVRHHRKVAVKVLRSELAAALGPERFLQEIEIAAQLQHPNILPLYDSGEADGFLFYVMPHIDGPSLREKLVKEGELPIGDAVRILRDVVDALTEAHAHGVVHRDIKPENILLSGRHALVTDFGVAKAVSEATSAHQLTTEGVALGTPAYMAPEQASADPHLDQRVDIYAVGAVAYELLAGRPVFMGTTSQMILSAHMTQPAEPVTRHRDTVPAALEAVVMRCLEKRPADRWQSAEELLTQLEVLVTPSGGVTPTDTRPMPAALDGRRLLVLGAVAAVAVIVVIAVLLSRVLAPSPITITTSNVTSLTREAGVEYQPAISPDGEEVAYVGGHFPDSRLVVRSTISGGESRPAADVGGRHRHPVWTPDGASLRFFVWNMGSGGSWHEVGKLGGSVRTISRPWKGNDRRWSGYNVLSPDGTWVVASRNDSIFAYTADSGEPELLGVHPVESFSPHSFTWSPDERLIAYADGASDWRDILSLAGGSSIWIIDAEGGEPVRVTDEGFVDISPAWLDDEHLLFVSDRDGPREVYVVEVGPSGPRGEPRKVAGATDAHTISYSIAGRKLAFSKATISQNVWSYPIDSGTVSIALGRRVTSENAHVRAHDTSPDGRWIAYSSDLRGDLDIYKRPVEGGNPALIVDSPLGDADPRWSPDGTEIAFHTEGGAENVLMVVPSDGGTPVELARGAPWVWLSSWSPTGLELAFNSNQSGKLETWVVSREAIGGPWSEPTQITDFGCEPSDWAPDGNGVLCTVGTGVHSEADTSLVLVSREGAVLWRYDPATAGLVLTSVYQKFSRDGSTIYARGTREDGTEGIWAIPVQGGEPSLVVAYDRAEIVAQWYLSVGPDRLYLTVAQTEADIWVADVEVER